MQTTILYFWLQFIISINSILSLGIIFYYSYFNDKELSSYGHVLSPNPQLWIVTVFVCSSVVDSIPVRFFLARTMWGGAVFRS